jgi:DNA helicase-2/ATP-dependent DNA helicase PcrA
MEWSPQQLAVYAWFVTLGAIRSIVVRARAGCGKTTTIVEGIKRYVATCVAQGGKVAVIASAFNTKITKELLARLAGLIGVEVKGLNSLGFYYVRQAVRRVTLDNECRKYDVAKAIEPQASRNLISLLANLHTKARELKPYAKCGADLEDLADQFNLRIDEDMSAEGWTQEGLCEAAYDCMVYASRNFQVIDFADQIFLPLRNRWVFPMYDRVIIDETQDLSGPQLDMLIGSCKHGKRGFCIVGDDMQAIYGFRGADVTAVDRLKTELDAEEINLNVTRRCPKAIVTEAQAYCPDFVAADDAPDGTVTHSHTSEDMLDHVRPGDFILSRTNAPLAGLCLKLLRNKVPAYVAGRNIGQSLAATVRRLKLDRIEDLQDGLAAYAAKRNDQISRNKRAMNDEWLAGKQSEISDEVDTILAVADGCVTINELFGRLSDLFADEGNGVMLSTTHKAKGLEADRVWLCWGTFDRKDADSDRIKYVAITRSKSELHYVKGFEKRITPE